MLRRISGFREDPVVYMYVLNAALALVVAWGLKLTNDQVGGIDSIATAVLGIVAAFRVRPVDIPVLKGLLTAGLVALGAFGLHLSADKISAVTVAASIVVSLLLRQAVTPTVAQKR